MATSYWWQRRRSVGAGWQARMGMPRLLVGVMLACAPVVPAYAGQSTTPALPLVQEAGSWDAGHVQGIAVDERNGFVYYSFTTLLAKVAFDGTLVGTLQGWTGHLGDLDFNAADGKVYGSLEYKDDQAFYIAVIDVSRIDRIGMQASRSDLMQTVYLAEVAKDYTADVDGDGRFDGNVADTADHRYGCSGIDGVGFGPAFGRTDGPRYLTVAYGIYANTARSDNDHQVLLQYDVSDWGKFAQPLTEASPHHSGPVDLRGKYFLHTGNTSYGVQTLAYDDARQRWWLGVYRGKKAAFPNYGLFAVDARIPPRAADLPGVPAANGSGWEQASVLSLADDGLHDAATGIRGWQQKADVGFQPVGPGQYLLATNTGGKGAHGAVLQLMRWSGDASHPFVPVAAEAKP
ncbi:hypothetical protein [Pseudoxanthomonas indica]|uniref:Uncharacterized protein n=1 Tax=Pseudoxanthomonas indica TaxID=428993 RepID=A0A1T5IX87_9GAMM|nr:hypothetical protein [Pseudoxanthomonas indica]GGD54922.1 hypothetical protein GCM10007235_28980 [Pseudoxanthomonas indica]SKC43786.1 hypothetical protein SAMN06296058_0319 [Pseudoxanthomonas indica]